MHGSFGSSAQTGQHGSDGPVQWQNSQVLTITFTNLHLAHVHTSYGDDKDPDVDDDDAGDAVFEALMIWVSALDSGNHEFVTTDSRLTTVNNGVDSRGTRSVPKYTFQRQAFRFWDNGASFTQSFAIWTISIRTGNTRGTIGEGVNTSILFVASVNPVDWDRKSQ